ncbi:MAG: hypothetical protein ACP5N2_05200 [Candidatus Nanoarchaeia archaeon]
MTNKQKVNKKQELKQKEFSNYQSSKKTETSTKIETLKKIEIPYVKELTDKEKIQIFKEELIKKDKIIDDLERENKLLLDLTMKNAKRRLEEIEQKIDNK